LILINRRPRCAATVGAKEWRRALARGLRRAVELEWIDGDEPSAPNQPGAGEVRTLVYERLS